MNKTLKILLFATVFMPWSSWADDPNYDTATRIISFPRLTVDSTDAYINGELLLNLNGTWDILAIEPQPEPELNLTGDWSGELDGLDSQEWHPPLKCGSIPTEILLIQNGNNLTGTGMLDSVKEGICGGETGVLTGEVNGKNITFAIIFPGIPEINFDGSISDDYQTLIGVGSYGNLYPKGTWVLNLKNNN